MPAGGWALSGIAVVALNSRDGVSCPAADELDGLTYVAYETTGG